MRGLGAAAVAVALGLGGAVALPTTAAAATPQTVRFGYTGGEQQWEVPAGVTSVRIVATGASGGGFGGGAPGGGAPGARAAGTVPVTPGTRLYVEVGGDGISGLLGGSATGKPGGFNGGGAVPPANGYQSGSGGGATDVRTVPRLQGGASLPSRLVTASGGGGSSLSLSGGNSQGGAGNADGTGNGASGATGGDGTTSGGRGATQTAPGAGSGAGQAGQLGVGGNGDYAGGGGGGGVYGGGGGGTSAGGGGGSSGFAVGATDLTIGTATGPASVTITWTPPTPPAPPAPDTTITKAPKKKSPRAKVKVGFTGTAGATYECSLDGKPFAACTSPYKVKVRRGKHTLAVRAVLAGVVDPTPATVSFKRTRRR